jgi:hypothetical protein
MSEIPKAEFDEIAAMIRTNNALVYSAAEMLAMLKRLEWSREERALSGGNLWCCPICIEAGMGGHHKPDCKLAALIAKAEGRA